jgi:hypothetical protein
LFECQCRVQLGEYGKLQKAAAKGMTNFIKVVNESIPQGEKKFVIAQSSFSSIAGSVAKINQRDDLFLPPTAAKLIDFVHNNKITSQDTLAHFAKLPSERAKEVEAAMAAHAQEVFLVKYLLECA